MSMQTCQIVYNKVEAFNSMGDPDSDTYFCLKSSTYVLNYEH